MQEIVRIQIKKIINNNSLVAVGSLKQGDILSPFKASTYYISPSRFSIQLEENTHIELDPDFLRYTNHSCEPNLFFDTKKMEVVCLRDIVEGEDLTYFYPSTEWALTEPFECKCGSILCSGWIRGAAFITKEAINRYQYSPYILKKLSSLQQG